MGRRFQPFTLAVLRFLADRKELSGPQLRQQFFAGKPAKQFYNFIFRLRQQELIEEKEDKIYPTTLALALLRQPVREAEWKLIIYDIPEQHRQVRQILRDKLKALYFKRWQHSIWVTPYKLDPAIEQELNRLAAKYFIRLIRVKSINVVGDLERLFPGKP